jgi:hypothetical protein
MLETVRLCGNLILMLHNFRLTPWRLIAIYNAYFDLETFDSSWGSTQLLAQQWRHHLSNHVCSFIGNDIYQR